MMLDDETGRSDVAGQFWDNEDLNRELDGSQLSVASTLYEAGAHWLLQNLVTRELPVALASNTAQFPLPQDYMFPLAATINGRPCRMHMAGVGSVYQEHNHYGCAVQGGSYVMLWGSGQIAVFKYIRKPTPFNVDPTLNRTEFPTAVYTAILWHAASALMIKDDSNTRYMEHFTRTIKSLLSEPSRQKFLFGEEVM